MTTASERLVVSSDQKTSDLPLSSDLKIPSGDVPRPRSEAEHDRPSAKFVLTLGALIAIGPLTIDTYLPAFPSITQDLETTSSAVQLTLTGTLIGLALG